MTRDDTDPRSEGPFLLIKGDASPEEVAALTVVLQAMAASYTAPTKRPRPQWSAPQRLQRPTLRPGPGAWRASSLPH